MGDQLVKFMQRFDTVIRERFIEVPKTTSSSRCSRMLLMEPETAGQLVEVPDVVSFSSLQQQTAQQRFPSRSLTFQFASSISRPTDEAFDGGFFALFPEGKKAELVGTSAHPR